MQGNYFYLKWFTMTIKIIIYTGGEYKTFLFRNIFVGQLKAPLQKKLK